MYIHSTYNNQLNILLFHIQIYVYVWVNGNLLEGFSTLFSTLSKYFTTDLGRDLKESWRQSKLFFLLAWVCVCACECVCVFVVALVETFLSIDFVYSATQRKLFVCTRRSGYTYVYILYRMYVWGFEKDSLVKRVKEVWLSDGCYCQVLNKLRITRVVHEPRPLFKLRPRADCPQKYAMRMDEVSCRTVRMYEWVYVSVSLCVCGCVCCS